MAEIITADVVAHDGTGQVTLRFATQGYVTKATDTPANTNYEARIVQPGNVARTIFRDRTTFGQSQVAYGEVVLVNNDGALDYLLQYGFAGFPITIKRGVVLPNSGGVPTWTTLLTGIMDAVEFSWDQVYIKVRDRQQEVAKLLQQDAAYWVSGYVATGYAVQNALYGGTNVLPNGLDGVAADLKGRGKPILYGQAFNIPAPCVNTTRQIYQVSDGAVQSIDAVYHGGVALSAGTAYTSQADMEANAPAAGVYRVWNGPGGAFVRLAGTPNGAVTVDATQGAATANRTAAQIMNLVLQKVGVAPADINAADVTALDAAAPYAVGYWVSPNTDETGSKAMDALANSVGAWWGVDRLGKFRMGQIVDPSGAASVGTITAVDVLKIDRLRSGDQGAGVPAWQVRLNYKRMFLVQEELGAGASASLKSERATEYRSVVVNDVTVKNKYPKAVEIEFDTLLVDPSNASAEATRRHAIYKVHRDLLQVRARLDDALASAVDIGKVVTLQLPRFSMAAGKKFLVTGIRTDLRNNIFELTLWG